MTEISRALDISGVKDVSDCIPDPIRRFDAAKVVDYQNLDGQYWFQEADLGDITVRPIAILDLPK
jgi:hypothetical protein